MRFKANRLAAKVALIYISAAAIWILFSDELVGTLVSSPQLRVQLSIVKGWGFVLLTGGLLYLVLWRLLRNLELEAARRQHAAAKLSESEQQLRLVMEASADGLWDWNLETGVAHLSPRYCEMSGYPAGEVVANLEFFQRLVHPEDWPAVQTAMEEHLAGKSTHSAIEYRMITKDGTVKWIWGRGKVVARAPDGTPLRMVGTIADTTERKRMEMALRLSDFSVNYGSLPTFWITRDAQVVRANRAACEQLGYTETEILQLAITDLDPDFPMSRWPAHWRELREQKHLCFETRHRHQDGHLIPVEVELNWFEFGGQEYNFAYARDITERKRAEAALRESEEKFSRMFASSPVATSVSTMKEGRYLDVNEAWLKMFDWSREEAVGHTVHELGIWSDLAQRAKLFAQLKEHGAVHNFEMELRTKSGQPRQILWSGARMAFGGEDCLLGSALDITERKQTDAVRQELTDELLQAQRIARLGSYSFDALTGEWTSSAALDELFGLGGPGGKKDVAAWLQIVHPEDRADMQHYLFEQVMRGHVVFDRNYRIVRQNDQQERWVHGLGKLVLDDAGRVVQMLGTIQDITERKRTEAALEESQALYQSLVTQLPIGIFRKNEFGQFVLVNPAFCQLKGVQAEEFLGKTPTEVHAGEVLLHKSGASSSKYAGLGEVHHRHIMETGETIELEEESVSVDGRKHFLQVIKFPVLNQAGNVLGSQGVLFDITERKKSELQLRKLSRVVDQSPVMAIITDVTGAIEYVNPAFTQVTGYRLEEVLGKTPRILKSGRMSAQTYKEIWATITAGQTWSGELFNRKKNGELFWERDTISPLLDAAGKVTHYIAMKEDITLRKQVEVSLFESEKKYRGLFENSRDAIVTNDASTGKFTSGNPAALKMFGVKTEAEFMAYQPSDFSPECQPDGRLSREKAKEMTELALREGSHFFEWTHRSLGGAEFFADVLLTRMERAGKQFILATVRDITERKRAEKSLLQSEEFKQAVLDSVSAHIAVLDPTGMILAVNERWQNFARENPPRPGELVRNAGVGVNYLEVCRQSALNGTTEAKLAHDGIEAVIAGQRPTFFLEYRCDSPIKLRWFSMVVTPLGQAGQAVVVSHSDITERKKSEILLQESEARFRKILQMAPLPLCIANKNKEIHFRNTRFLEIIGYSAEEVPDVESWFQRAYPDPQYRLWVVATWDGLIQRAANEGRDFEPFEYRVTCQDGRERIMEISGILLGEELFVTFIDLTERKQKEDELRWQAAQLEAQLEAALDGILVVDNHGRRVLQNQQLLKLFKVPPHIIRDPDDSKLLQHVVSQTRNPAQFVERVTYLYAHPEEIGREEIELADGRILERYSAPVYDRMETYLGRIWTFRDITKGRQLESQLRQAQKMEAIGTLAGGIAHDFNNILAAMFGYGYLLQQDTAENFEAQESVAEIMKAATRAKDLVQQILTFSRQREQKREVIPLDTVVKEATKFLRASLPAEIKIQVLLAEEAPTVLADPTQIYQVTMNLATNALHAMEGRPGLLAVSLESFLPDTKFIQAHPEFRPVLYARLTVSDTGQGMDARTLERIFEPFFTTKPVGKGTGLGLAVVHGIVQSHDGFITVESQLGEGTTFCLYFPAQASQAALIDAAVGKAAPGGGQKILLLDDESALTAPFQRLLERLNYHVTTRNSAREAVSLFRENPTQFDLVITDLTMPEMNGLEVARQLQEMRPGLPIILVSGFTPDLNHEKLRVAGICELLEKPVSMKALADVLKRALAEA